MAQQRACCFLLVSPVLLENCPHYMDLASLNILTAVVLQTHRINQQEQEWQRAKKCSLKTHMASREKKALYLDVCTLCRPFDDQSQMRIHLETNVYYLILQAIREAKHAMFVSPVHFEEVNAISETQEKQEILTILETLGTQAYCDMVTTRARAEDLHTRRFGVADAAHIAFAEATANVFITCDDRLLKRSSRERPLVPVMNPVEFVIAEDLK